MKSLGYGQTLRRFTATTTYRLAAAAVGAFELLEKAYQEEPGDDRVAVSQDILFEAVCRVGRRFIKEVIAEVAQVVAESEEEIKAKAASDRVARNPQGRRRRAVA